jgi:hypothetical protein
MNVADTPDATFDAEIEPPVAAALSLTQIRDRSRALLSDCDRLSVDILTSHLRPAFRTTWIDFRDQLVAFQRPIERASRGQLDLDRLQRQLEQWEQRLTWWRDAYRREPAPPTTGVGGAVTTAATTAAAAAAPGFKLPWWAKVAIGAGLLGGGYYMTRRILDSWNAKHADEIEAAQRLMIGQ